MEKSKAAKAWDTCRDYHRLEVWLNRHNAMKGWSSHTWNHLPRHIQSWWEVEFETVY